MFYINIDLLSLVSEYGLLVRDTLLPAHTLGYYYNDGNYRIILMNELIADNKPLYRCVLAEEIGHHLTSSGDLTPREHLCYRDRLVISKQEMLALKWATDILIPTQILIDIIRKDKCCSQSDAAEYFMITGEFLHKKFLFMSKQKGIWPIDETRDLYLLDYPSIYIFEHFNN